VSAIEQYSAKTLRQRAFAFEGTVVGIETRVDPRLPDRDQERSWVTFQVNRWFRGGTADEVSIWFDGLLDLGTKARQTSGRQRSTREPGHFSGTYIQSALGTGPLRRT
jgi:hypothetical protein